MLLKRYRTYLKPLFFCVLLVSSLCATTVLAAPLKSGISISPPDFRIVALPNKPIKGSFTVTDNLTVPVSVNLYTGTIEATNTPSGNVTYANAPADYKYSLPLSIDRKSFVLQPKQAQQVNFNADGLQGTTGTYSGAIYIRVLSQNQVSPIKIATEYQFNVLGSVGKSAGGAIIPTLDINNIAITGFTAGQNGKNTNFVFALPIDFDATVTNSGSILTPVTGYVEILKNGKKIGSTNSVVLNSYPGTFGHLKTSLSNVDGILFPNYYTARVILSVGQASIKRDFAFYYYPVWFLVVVAAALICVILLIILFWRFIPHKLDKRQLISLLTTEGGDQNM